MGWRKVDERVEGVVVECMPWSVGRRMDGCVVGCLDTWAAGRMNGRTRGRLGGHSCRWVDRCMRG